MYLVFLVSFGFYVVISKHFLQSFFEFFLFSKILMSAWNSLPNVKMNHRSARTPMDHTNVFAKKDCIG